LAIERLGNVPDDACVFCAAFVIGGRAPREDEHGDRRRGRICAKRFGDVVARAVGHEVIGENDVRTNLFGARHGLGTASGFDDVEGLLVESDLDSLLNRHAVIRDEDGVHRSGLAPMTTSSQGSPR